MRAAVDTFEEQRLIIEDLSLRLEEAQDILSAVRGGEVDALVVRTAQGERVYTLNGAENAYRVLFETLNEGAVTLSHNGTVLYANLRFAHMVGLPLEKVLGARFHQFVAGEHSGAFDELIGAGLRDSAKAELSICTGRGSLVPVMMSVRACNLDASPPTCTAVVADLTELRRAQEALEQANAELEQANVALEARVLARTAELLQANRVLESEIEARRRLESELRQQAEELAEASRRKDEFLAMLGHELRNPLAPILNALQTIKLRWPNQERLQKQREIIERQTRHLARLVDDLLDVSRITRGTVVLRTEPVDLTDVMERALEAVRPTLDESGHTLLVSMPETPVVLEADAARLEQILVNLLKNAAKYTPPNGRISCRAERQGNDVVVRVQDNGIGIAPELLPKVFDLFVQDERALDRSQGGLGIGLTLVKRLVQLHGGEVRAHSAGRGQGSEFVLRLPCLSGAVVARAEARASRTRPSPERRRVLIVEDNPDAADTLLELVELWGYEGQVVHDGIAAVETAVRYRPHVILCDLGLPRLDGYEVARRLRQMPDCREAFLIALTGYGREADVRHSREAGFDLHLTKPVDPDHLGRLLRSGARRPGWHVVQELADRSTSQRAPEFGV